MRAGDIMQILYNIAHKVARQHSGTDVTAARVDEIVFYHPLLVGEVAEVCAFITFIGHTSMEIEVQLFNKSYPSTKPILQAFLTMVAIGEDHLPTPVPKLLLSSDEEHIRFDEGKARYLARKNSRLTLHPQA